MYLRASEVLPVVPSPSITALSLYNSSESSALSIKLGFNAAMEIFCVSVFWLSCDVSPLCLRVVFKILKTIFTNTHYFSGGNNIATITT